MRIQAWHRHGTGMAQAWHKAWHRHGTGMAQAWHKAWHRHGTRHGTGMAPGMAQAWHQAWHRHGTRHGTGMAHLKKSTGTRRKSVKSSQNQYSGVFKVSIGVQTYAEASTGDIFLKKISFFQSKYHRCQGDTKLF
jgi:hypothetical protein